MRRREFIAALGVAAIPFAARSQERVRRLAVLMPFEEQDAFGRESMAAIHYGLKELGWVVGRNFHVEVRWIGNNPRLRQQYAAELVKSSPDVLFACFAGQLEALRSATRDIPIVFVGVSDPVAAGYVESFARPGGHITGFVFFEPSMVGKWVAILKEIAPTVSRMGFMVNPDTSPHYGNYLKIFQNVVPRLSIEPVTLFVRGVPDIEDQITVLAREPHSGLLVAPDTFTAQNRVLIATVAARLRVPAAYVFRPAVNAGGLVSYGPDQIEVFRQAGNYIDRILRGERAADLPVQAPTKFELAVNLKAAKALGITISDTFLLRADEVIE